MSSKALKYICTGGGLCVTKKKTKDEEKDYIREYSRS